MGFKVAFKGQKELMAAMTLRQKLWPKKVKATLVLRAELIMTASKRLCPVDKGVLVNTGHVSYPPEDWNIAVTLAYGGAAEDYAVVVHEDLEAQHKPGKQAKYLEEPLNEAMPTILADIAREAPLT